MFNFKNVETSNYSPLACGEYLATINNFEKKVSQAGNPYYSLTLDVNNRKIFEVLNLFHPTEMVRNIALSKVKSLLLAMGFDADSLTNCSEQQLEAYMKCGNKFIVELGIKADERGEKNIIKKFLPVKRVDNAQTSSIPF